MKKLKVIILLFFITVKGFSQCGVVSGIQPETNLGFGSHLNADYILDSGWNIYSYSWTVNGDLVATSQNILNEGIGYDDVCLTIKATNPITGDSCESKYCQLYYSTFPWLVSINIQVAPTGPLTMQFSPKVCGVLTGVNNQGYLWKFGDGTTSNSNLITHTYADTGTYNVTLTYGMPIPNGFNIYDSITRKVYVDNGHLNHSINATSSNANCFSISSLVNSTPQIINGDAGELDPFHYTLGNVAFQSGVPFVKSFYGTGFDVIHMAALDSLGNAFGTCSVVAIPDCKIIPDTMNGTVWLDSDADAIWDVGEGFYNGPGLIGYSVGRHRDSINIDGTYSLSLPPAPGTVGIGILPSNLISTTPWSYFTENLPIGTNHFGYNFGVVDLGVNVCGKAFIDVNTNTVFDSGTDLLYKSVLISVLNTTLNRTFSALTDQSGNYCIEVPVGNYVVKAFGNNLDSAVVSPDSIIINAPVPANFFSNDFAFQTPVQGGNLGIFLSSGGMPRPGFGYSLGSSVTNSGIDTSSGTVVLNYSPTLIYVNSTFGGVNNASLKTVTWQTGVMAPTTAKYYSANFTVPVPTPLGTILISSSSVTTAITYTDYNLNNNISSHNSTVVGSFDPNDKLVAPHGAGIGGNVLHGQRLYYRINFQNTGTAEAINIIVQDEIDPNLDMNTFRMERASDTYDIIIVDNTVTWKFFSIMLPDSNSNEPGSHGFIEFSIKAIQGLPDGTVIANDADIYFDFNPPIITNTVSNTLQTTLTGISEYSMESDINVFPNPVNNILNIQIGNSHSGKKVISVFNKLGENVYKVVTNENQIEIPMNVSPGVYYIEVRTENRNYTKRILKL